MGHLLRTIGAFSVVFVSMSLGVTLALVYAWFVWPVPRGGSVPFGFASLLSGRGGTVPVRLEQPLSRDGDASKAAVFDEEAVTSLYQKSAPAVVAISISSNGQRQGLGSGVIVRADGIVLTNNHVVRGAKQIDVALSDRSSYV